MVARRVLVVLALAAAVAALSLQPKNINFVETTNGEGADAQAEEYTVPPIDSDFKDAFDVDGKADDEQLAAPDAQVQTNDPREEGKESRCDPNQPPDPAAFGGAKSVTVMDLPDPGCTNFTTCGECLANRMCGWCAADSRCTMSRSQSPECAFNENTDVCAPPCKDMWHLNWPEGRMGLVSGLCEIILVEYQNGTAHSTWHHFAE